MRVIEYGKLDGKWYGYLKINGVIWGVHSSRSLYRLFTDTKKTWANAKRVRLKVDTKRGVFLASGI